MSDVDTSNGLFSLLADIQLTLGQVARTNQRLERELAEARSYEQPVWLDIQGQGVANASGFVVIPFTNAPDQGHQWSVRRLWVGGSTSTTVAAGRVDIYRGNGLENGQFTSLASIGMNQWEDFSASLPARAQYARGELIVAWPDRLYAVVSSGTSTQTYVATGRIQDVQQAAYKAVTEL